MTTDTPEQIARWSISSYREFTERYGQSPDEATEAAVREVLEGLAVDVAAERAEMAAHPGPTPEEMEGWPL
jgi:ethanolamine ammonia-lyase large subunit